MSHRCCCLYGFFSLFDKIALFFHMPSYLCQHFISHFIEFSSLSSNSYVWWMVIHCICGLLFDANTRYTVNIRQLNQSEQKKTHTHTIQIDNDVEMASRWGINESLFFAVLSFAILFVIGIEKKSFNFGFSIFFSPFLNWYKTIGAYVSVCQCISILKNW